MIMSKGLRIGAALIFGCRIGFSCKIAENKDENPIYFLRYIY